MQPQNNSQIQFELFGKNFPGLLWVKNKDLQYVYCNTAFGEAFGIEPDKLIGHDDFSIMPKAAADSVRENDRKVLNSQSAATVEEDVPIPCGPYKSKRHWLVSKFPLGDGSIAGIATNITDKKFGIIFEQSKSGFAIVGLDGRWLSVNDACCKMLGREREELMDMTFQDITYKDDLNKDLSLVKECIDGKRDSYVMDKRYLKPNGDLVYAKLSVNIVKYPNTNIPQFFISQIDDLTENKEYAIELESLNDLLAASNEELERFAYVASHDLKAPLRNIKNISEWVIEDINDKKKVKNYCKKMQTITNRMQALVDGLLEYSRIGRQHSETELFDIRQTFTDLESPLNIVDRPVNVYANKTRVYQIVSNLIDNAIKHHKTPKRAKVVCTAKEYDGHWEFCVSDNGPGIDKKYHKKIFEIFQTLSSDKSNTGMGLPLVKKILDDLGGKIWLKSDVAKGSKFYFTLPKEIRLDANV